MPSTKNPSALTRGPGRLPANVVTASALVSPQTVEVQDTKYQPIVAVTDDSTTILRKSTNHVLLVQTAQVAWQVGTRTITLPVSPVNGDAVMVIDADGGAPDDPIIIDGGVYNIDGAGTSLIVASRGSSTFRFVGVADGVTVNEWQLESRADNKAVFLFVDDSSSGAYVPAARAPHTYLLVDTNAGPWSASDYIELGNFSTALQGDLVTIINVGTVLGVRVKAALNPWDATADISVKNAMTFINIDGAGTWVRVGGSEATFQSVADTTVLTALMGNHHYVYVDTSQGTWTANKTVTLKEAVLNTQYPVVTVTDVGNLAGTKPIDIVPPVGHTINGSSGHYILAQDYGSVTVAQTGSTTWAIVGRALPDTYETITDTLSLSAKRRSANHTIGVVTADANWTSSDTIALPVSTAVAGDRITIMDISGGSGDTIQVIGKILGSSSNNLAFNNPYGSITFEYVDSTLGWQIVASRATYTYTVNTATTLNSFLGPWNVEAVPVIVKVTTASGWNGVTDELGLSISSPTGMKIRIFDAGGNAAAQDITIQGSGGQTINGAASFTIATNWGSIALEYLGSLKWVITSKGY